MEKSICRRKGIPSDIISSNRAAIQLIHQCFSKPAAAVHCKLILYMVRHAIERVKRMISSYSIYVPQGFDRSTMSSSHRG